MKTRKRLLALLLAWSLTLSLCLGMGGAVSADSADSPLFYTSENEDGTLTISGLTEAGFRCEALTIPAAIGGKRVTAITSIYDYYDSPLTTLTLSPGIERIEKRGFTEFGNLKSVSLPATLTYFSGQAFAGCDRFETISVAEENPVFCAKDGVLFTKDMSTLVRCAQATEEGYRVPDGVKRIGAYAFYFSFLTQVQLPDGLTEIGANAFSHSYFLTEIHLPDSITAIGESAFSDCTSLSLHSLPSRLTEINPYTFLNCGDLTGIAIPAGVTEIGLGAFCGCHILSELAISEKVSRMDTCALSGCSGVNVAAENPYFCSADGVLFSKDMSRLITYPAYKAGERYAIPDGVTTICEAAFRNAQFSEVTLPNGVESIGASAFLMCQNLKSMNIPDSVTDIGYAAFRLCYALYAVSLPSCLLNRDGIFDSIADVTSRVCNCTQFADMPPQQNWAHYGIEFCVTQGLMKGMTEHAFSPGSALTRAQLVTILYRMAGSPSVTPAAGFRDVAAGKWYAAPIAWASANGIVNGYPDGTFRPNGAITREQFAAILYRYGGEDIGEEQALRFFPDVGKVSLYAWEAMNWAVYAELINGTYDGITSQAYLLPQGSATRAQAATIIQRFLQKTDS